MDSSELLRAVGRVLDDARTCDTIESLMVTTVGSIQSELEITTVSAVLVQPNQLYVVEGSPVDASDMFHETLIESLHGDEPSRVDLHASISGHPAESPGTTWTFPVPSETARWGIVLDAAALDDAYFDALHLITTEVASQIRTLEYRATSTRQERRLKTAYALSRHLIISKDRESLYATLTQGIIDLFQCARVALHEQTGVIVHEAGHGSDPFAEESALIFAMSAFEKQRFVEEIEPGYARWSLPLGDESSTRPLVLYGESRAPRSMSAPDLQLLTEFAEHAETAMSLLDAGEDIERNFQSTITALASAMEANDRYTHEHSNEVASWALQVGKRLDLDEKGLRDLELAAVFHDIGKIAIPSDILNKPDKLTAEEFELMKTHTIIGVRIIQPIELLRDVCPLVRHEHERWDGHGYPDGIAGPSIPLGSRIIFVCDAYHAITSDRPYRKARSHEIARQILLENAGSQFDPAVVMVFLDVLDAELNSSERDPKFDGQIDLGDDAAAAA